MINNRQNGRRNRGRGGVRPQGGPGGNNGGSRIDNRSRGNANQLHEKYKTLARDAQLQGDRVMTEYYLQFADHYFRVLNENRARFEEQNPRREREIAADDYDDGEIEGDGVQGGDDRDGDRGYQPQRRVARQERFERAPREQQPPRGGEDRAERPQPSVEEAVEAAPVAEEAPRPRRGRRPRAEQQVEVNGAEDHRIEIDRLPPAFEAKPAAVPTPANEIDGGESEEARPRRRTRRPRGEAATAEA